MMIKGTVRAHWDPTLAAADIMVAQKYKSFRTQGFKLNHKRVVLGKITEGM